MRIWIIPNYFRIDEKQNFNVAYTEEDILKEYWVCWCNAMYRVGKGHLISREWCIQDWAMVNWATGIGSGD